MAPKSFQFGKNDFDEYMGGDDDDDSQSVGSDHEHPFGLLGKQSEKASSSRPGSAMGGLGSRPGSAMGGLGGLGGLGKGGLGKGGLGGLGGLGAAKGGLGRGLTGGLGASLGNKETSKGLQKETSKGLQKETSKGLQKEKQETQSSTSMTGQEISYVVDIAQKLSSLQLEVLSSNKKTEEGMLKALKSMQEENIKAMKSITSFVHDLSENMLNGYREISKMLNRHPDEQINVQQAIEEHIVSIDEEIHKNTDDQTYILIPGSEDSTVTYEEAVSMLKDKTIHIYGSVRSLAYAGLYKAAENAEKEGDF